MHHVTEVTVNYSSGFTGNIIISIYDAAGNKIREFLNKKNKTEYIEVIDISALSLGVYYLTITEDKTVLSEKFIRE